MSCLLCVFAHPDDECYGPGGTIAQCVLDGVDVFVTTFTAGEAGTIGISKSLAPGELARRRRLELAAACRELGVAEHRILGAPDRGVAAVDPAWAVREILADMDRYRPQVVLTFHHRGVSGHPDHVAVANFLERACEEVGEAGPARSYEWGIPASKAPLYERPNLDPLADQEVAARVPIGDAAMDRKLAAIRAHATQYDFFLSLQAKFDYREVATPEHFALRRSRGPTVTRVISNLFEGMNDA
jgi:N-acetyl-1-D-myo-inositol-2-amino-2-deoxy-alpha-D-glucopyranoside deacetylase